MLNQSILVGRIKDNPKIITEDGKDKISLIIGVQRAYKNSNGKYDTDYLKCILWNNIATNTADYCKAGDIVGIKGRLQSKTYEHKNNEVEYVTEIIAEKITFLSSKATRNEI